jgi:hypothetical protein
LSQALVKEVLKDWRKLVLIHKEYGKEKASKFRTLIVASIFAKILGGLLKSKSSKWVEAYNKRAISQARFKAHYNTLDYVLCLRVLGCHLVKNILTR